MREKTCYINMPLNHYNWVDFIQSIDLKKYEYINPKASTTVVQLIWWLVYTHGPMYTLYNDNNNDHCFDFSLEKNNVENIKITALQWFVYSPLPYTNCLNIVTVCVQNVHPPTPHLTFGKVPYLWDNQFTVDSSLEWHFNSMASTVLCDCMIVSINKCVRHHRHQIAIVYVWFSFFWQSTAMR